MRKIILLMHVSLDGYVAGPKGEMDWIELGDELWDYVTEITDSSDTALYGAVTYRMMEDYWPTAAEKPDASKHDIDHSKWANAVEKLVFSTSMNDEDIHWKGARIVRDHIAEEMAKLKAMPGKNMLMLGSPSLAQSFMELGLIDEFCLNINPIILGSGKPLFKELKNSVPLQLVSEKKLANGVVTLRYKR